VAVLDASWWGFWWPWMAVWAGTAGRWWLPSRSRSRTGGETAGPPGGGSAFYLDDDFVMDLYALQGGKYRAALRQEIEEKITNNQETGVLAELAPVRAGGRRSVNSEVLRRYIEEAEPITVIGIILDVLDHADDIVAVDLRRREVVANRALAAIVDTADDEASDAVRLRGMDTFVSVRAQFRLTERTDSAATFQAPYGNPTDPTEGPRCTSRAPQAGCAPPSPTVPSQPTASAVCRTGTPRTTVSSCTRSPSSADQR